MARARLTNYALLLLRITALALVFVAVFAGTTGGIALVLSWLRGADFAARENLVLGMICGLVVWLFVAVFHLRREALLWHFSHKDFFLVRITRALTDLGYELVAHGTEHLRFRPSFWAFLLGGDVLVTIGKRSAKFSGPKVSLERLRHQLRWQNHLQHSRRNCQERRADKHYKRVQLTLRLPLEPWPNVYRHVVQVLAEEAELICDLHIMAQSDDGVRESTLESIIHPWLEDKGIAVEIHKNLVEIMPPGGQAAAENDAPAPCRPL